MKTELNDRTLWFDGTNQVLPWMVPRLLLDGVPINRIVVTELDEDLIQFNNLADEGFQTSKVKLDQIDMTWDIPKKYRDIDLKQYLLSRLAEFWIKHPEDKVKYSDRVIKELEEIQVRGMEMLVKTLIYMVDELRKSNTVWGVGRGSSCASLVLFLIGLHKVDPIRFNIPLTEFFHE